MRTLTGLVAALGFFLGAGAAPAQDASALAEEGKALIRAFAGALKGELTAAIEAGGPASAVEVCKLRAPEIAASVSSGSGWTVVRSSHRLRNPANEPDPYTAAAIRTFLEREAEGTPAADLAQAEIVEEGGERVFRLVRAIPTAGLCLRCHGGDEVPAEVEAALAEHYPYDEARGFAEGEMRGVFTLSKPLD